MTRILLSWCLHSRLEENDGLERTETIQVVTNAWWNSTGHCDAK